MSVTYKFLDKDKKKIDEYKGAACFYGANDQYKSYPEAVYFSYTLTTKFSEDIIAKYLTFLNNIKWFHQINIPTFLKTKTYTFKIEDKNSFKTFATLTVLRYLDEEVNSVKFILKNIDNTKISKLKLLLASAIYCSNDNHFLNQQTNDIKEFVEFKLKKQTFPKDSKITSKGLHEYFSTKSRTWAAADFFKKNLANHYGLIL